MRQKRVNMIQCYNFIWILQTGHTGLSFNQSSKWLWWKSEVHFGQIRITCPSFTVLLHKE